MTVHSKIDHFSLIGRQVDPKLIAKSRRIWGVGLRALVHQKARGEIQRASLRQGKIPTLSWRKTNNYPGGQAVSEWFTRQDNCCKRTSLMAHVQFGGNGYRAIASYF